MTFVFVPKVKAVVGAEGAVGTEISIDFDRTMTQSLDLECDNAHCKLTHKSSHTFDAGHPTVSQAIDLDAYAGPKFELLTDDISGPSLSVQGFVQAKVSTASRWELTGGFKAKLALTVDVWKIHGDWELEYDHDVIQLASESMPGPVSPTVTPAIPVPTDTPTPNPNCVESLVLSPSSGLPGSTVAVTWRDECDNVGVNGSVLVNGVQVATFVDPTDSGWSGSITIPANLQNGVYIVSVQDDDNSSGSATFAVTGAPTPIPTATDTPVPTDTLVPTGVSTTGGTVLKVGSSGEAVARVHRALRIPDDTIFGPQTQSDVLKFQQGSHLPYQDGEVGPETTAALFE